MVQELIGGAVFLTLGLVGTFVGVSYLRKWRTITNTETSTVRDAVVTDGLVEIEGTVEQVEDTPLESPMTKQDCVAFEYDIKRRKGTDSPSPVDHGERHQPFVIDDGTATAYIDPEHGELSLALEIVNSVSPDELPDYVHTNPKLQGSRKHKEGRIEPGDSAYIIGSTKSTQQPDCDTEFSADDGTFIISNQDQANTAKRILLRGVFLTPIGLVCAGVGSGILLDALGVGLLGV